MKQIQVLGNVDALDLLHLDEVLHLACDEHDIPLFKSKMRADINLLRPAPQLHDLKFQHRKIRGIHLLADER